jgi:hypothetical protein
MTVVVIIMIATPNTFILIFLLVIIESHEQVYFAGTNKHNAKKLCRKIMLYFEMAKTGLILISTL